jgi:hypothetical protein
LATSKKRITTIVMVSVWLAALGSAAAFALGLNPREHARHHDSAQIVAPCSSSVCGLPMGSAARPAEPGAEAERPLYLPAVIIAAPWPPRAATGGTRAPEAVVTKDLSEMDCTAPRELQIGSGRVRDCK